MGKKPPGQCLPGRAKNLTQFRQLLRPGLPFLPRGLVISQQRRPLACHLLEPPQIAQLSGIHLRQQKIKSGPTFSRAPLKDGKVPALRHHHQSPSPKLLRAETRPPVDFQFAPLPAPNHPEPHRPGLVRPGSLDTPTFRAMPRQIPQRASAKRTKSTQQTDGFQ